MPLDNTMTDEYDILIKDARVVDGTGAASYKASIGIHGDRIAALGDVKGDAVKEVDASGLVATPGFIDSHSHSDINILFYPNCDSHVHQGITTFFGGQCGISFAPLGDYVPIMTGEIMELAQELEPYMYSPKSLAYPLDDVNALMKERYGWEINWRTTAEYFAAVKEKGLSINYAPLVGHSTCRIAVLGRDYKRESRPDEEEAIGELVRQALDDGCVGLSTGMDYPADVYATRAEINAHVSILRDYPSTVYSPHWRRTGRREGGSPGIAWNRIGGIVDELETAKKTGVPLVVAHLCGGWDTAPAPPPALVQEAIGKATLDVIDQYIAEGVEASFDVIMYWWFTSQYMADLLPPYIRLLGSREALAKALKMHDFRTEIKQALKDGRFYLPLVARSQQRNYSQEIRVTEHRNTNYNDKTLKEIAAETGQDTLDTLFNLIAEDPDALCSTRDYRLTEDYIKLFYKHPRGMVGIDSSMVDLNHESKSPPWSKPLYRAFSAYPSFLNRYVKEQRLFTIEEAIRKCTSLPAKTHYIHDRGIIKEGNYADILLLDWENLMFLSTPKETRRYPEGIEYVIVNGETVIEKSKHTGVRSGKILSRDTK